MPFGMGLGKPVMLPLPPPAGVLPEAGGLLDQGAWLTDVFDLMEAEDVKLQKGRR